ncbi:DUF721 domain-containing protein [Corynebacterium incognita]|uniref:DUF721 domain-containing protein n=1 Tax=Corynebacterium incognita TaxID=2754725 RepID=A0A7G7CSH2_9CORY|nr:DciA family protein [Corynebacterium incognita]QNE90538.1 DUF721 domain-containing protein [Corynebacterium incognita]
MEDLITAAFETVRKRIPNPPHLNRPSRKQLQLTRARVIIPGLEEPMPLRTRGIPTGPDGRPRRRPHTVPSLGSALKKTIRTEHWEEGLAQGIILEQWPDIVGEKIAQHTRVDRIDNTVIYIECDSTAWKTNLGYMQRQILHKIADKVGPDNFTQLKLFVPNIPSWRKGKLHVKGRGPRDTYG